MLDSVTVSVTVHEKTKKDNMGCMEGLLGETKVWLQEQCPLDWWLIEIKVQTPHISAVVEGWWSRVVFQDLDTFTVIWLTMNFDA